MTTAPTIWNNATASAAAPHPMANASASANSSDPSMVTANDFLTLLVTEMKNQDPTSATDPNQYINQLVSVNSLEQLIQINQTLAAGLAASTQGDSQQSGSTAVPASVTQTDRAAAPSESSPHAHPVQFGRTHFPPAIAQGNLGVPAASPAAERVAQALSGHM